MRFSIDIQQFSFILASCFFGMSFNLTAQQNQDPISVPFTQEDELGDSYIPEVNASSLSPSPSASQGPSAGFPAELISPAYQAADFGNIGLELNNLGMGVRFRFFQPIFQAIELMEQVDYDRQAKERQDGVNDRLQLSVGPGVRLFKQALFSPIFALKFGYEIENASDHRKDAVFAGHSVGLNIRFTRNFWLGLNREDSYYSSHLTRVKSDLDPKPKLASHRTDVKAHFILAF